MIASINSRVRLWALPLSMIVVGVAGVSCFDPFAPPPPPPLLPCGDGVLGADEECDLGGNNGSPSFCRTTCAYPRCGDGVLDDIRTPHNLIAEFYAPKKQDGALVDQMITFVRNAPLDAIPGFEAEAAVEKRKAELLAKRREAGDFPF